MSELYLTPDELAIRTARKRKDAQIRVLIRKRIPYTLNGNEEPLVLRETVYKENGIRSFTRQPATPNVEGLKALG